MKTAGLASQSSSEQSSGMLSQTDTRSAFGKWDFTSPMVYWTASPATFCTKPSSRPCDAAIRTNISSARATPSGSITASKASSWSVRQSSFALSSISWASTSWRFCRSRWNLFFVFASRLSAASQSLCSSSLPWSRPPGHAPCVPSPFAALLLPGECSLGLCVPGLELTALLLQLHRASFQL